jgi:hypothetical protein
MRIILAGRQHPTYIVQYLVTSFLLIVIPTPSAQGQQQENQARQPDKQAPADQSPSEEDQAKELAKAVQNPVASLISVPLQNNTNFDSVPTIALRTFSMYSP